MRSPRGCLTQSHASFEDSLHIGLSPSGRGFRLASVQFVPRERDRVFEFFADAFQLEAITPPWLHFSVLTPAPIRIERGTMIDYRLRLRGIPLRWQSRISVWEPPVRFVDEQVLGPYRRWRHEHTFESAPGGTLCRDVVDYEVFGGRLVDALFVRSDVREIFRYRQVRLRTIFARSGSSREKPCET